MTGGTDIYYKVRDVVRQQGHSESESCRVFKDWHIELRVGSGHVSVWTSNGLVYLTMLDKPVHYKPGVWEEHLSRLHLGRPVLKPSADLRELLRAQALENEEEIEAGELETPAADAAVAVEVEAQETAESVEHAGGDVNFRNAQSAEPEPSTIEATRKVNGLSFEPARPYVFSDSVIVIEDDGA